MAIVEQKKRERERENERRKGKKWAAAAAALLRARETLLSQELHVKERKRRKKKKKNFISNNFTWERKFANGNRNHKVDSQLLIGHLKKTVDKNFFQLRKFFMSEYMQNYYPCTTRRTYMVRVNHRAWLINNHWVPAVRSKRLDWTEDIYLDWLDWTNMIERYYKVAIFILLTFIGQNKSTVSKWWRVALHICDESCRKVVCRFEIRIVFLLSKLYVWGHLCLVSPR